MESLFLKILNMSISAIWLIFAVIIIRIVLKKAPKAMRLVLWAIVALRLTVPFSFESVLSLIPSAETIPETIINQPLREINSGLTIIDRPVNEYLLKYNASLRYDLTIPPTQVEYNNVFPLSTIWLVGIGIMLIYSLTSYFVLYNRVKASINIKDNIYICDNIASPFILGIIKPKIYVPSSLTEEQLTYVLAHERAHIKRLDFLWKPIGFAVLAVHWFNPAVWLAYILLCRDIEFSCDEKVIKTMGDEDIKGYSETLLVCSVSKRMVVACPIAFGEVGVKQRIKTVLNYRKPMFWVIILAVLACVATSVFFLTDPPDDKMGDNNIVSGLSGVTDEGVYWFEAVIVGENKNTWLVKPCNGTTELKTSDKIYVKKTEVNVVGGYNYGVKSRVKIYYDGMIQETYPAKIQNVYGIQLVERFMTNIYYKYDSAFVKYITDKNDPIYTEALNADYLSLNNSPVHLVESFDEMKSFLEPYTLEDDSFYGVSYLLEKFDEEYFDKNSVLLIYAVESTWYKNVLSKVGIMDDTLHITFTQWMTDSAEPFGPECRIFAVGISKSNLEGCKYFYAGVNIDERLFAK